jgi:hypothetical protein
MNGLTTQPLAGEAGGKGWFLKPIRLNQNLFSKRVGFFVTEFRLAPHALRWDALCAVGSVIWKRNTNHESRFTVIREHRND